MSIPIHDRIARYEAWRRRELVRRPMVGLLWEADIPGLPEFLDRVGMDQWVSPVQVEPRTFLPYIARWFERESQWDSDIIQSWAPAFSIPWVEAIVGCPVKSYPGSLWAMPYLDSYENRIPIRLDKRNPWLRKMIEFTQALVQLADGRFPVALPQMRGPLDVLSSLRGAEQMSLDLIERPAEVRQLLDELTEVWIQVANACLDVIPRFHGGYTTRMKMWAPEHAITPQNDISTLISPKMYREFALPCDQKIMAHFPFHSFHLHGSAQHQIGNLVTLDNLTAIEIHLEHTVGGPSLQVMMTAARRILDTKPLLLVAMDRETVEYCLQELPARGLCVMLLISEPELSPEYDEWLAAHCTQEI